MDYTSLIAAKGTAGSIANWVNYSKVEPVLPTILDEAQALIYSLLRVREMRTNKALTMAVGTSSIALPARFLDPIGRLYAPATNMAFIHLGESAVGENRPYTTTTGTLATDPFTTALSSTTVTVAAIAHDFNQGSTIFFSGATAVGGLTLNGTFEITSISTNAFTITSDTAATSAATGGGAVVAYTLNNLIRGFPTVWSIWNEKIQFDQAFATQTSLALMYYQSLALLSSTNLTNFLTNRYPQLVRVACLTAAADFMKDDFEYAKNMKALTALVGSIAIENDMSYRGLELATDNYS